MRVPEVDLLVVAAAGRRPAPVRAEGRGEHDIVVAGIGDDLLAAGDVVDVACGLAIGHAARMPDSKSLPSGLKLKEPTTVPCLASMRKKRPSRAVPQPDFAGPIAAGDGAIRGHGKALHLIAMAGHVRDLLAIGHAPEPQIMIVGARHRAAAIGAEANGVDFVLMPFEPVQQLRLRPRAPAYPGACPDNDPVSQRMAVLSPLPEISLLPSGEKARP